MYLIYDLESSFSNDVDSPKDFRELLEIGAVIMDEDYNLIDSFQSYVALKFYSLTPECNDFLDGIQQHIEQADSLPVVWEQFEEWRQQYPITKTAAWGVSDETYLKSQLERYGIATDFFNIPFVDLKKAFRKSRPVKIPPVGLFKACEIIELEMVGKHHSAADDATNAMLVAKDGNLLGN
ncbi:exonuclease domain-containing protein [Kangiella sp.]|uniref:exonuclease domain-containing protein n=1 Tax=Kangiella sp. TaxID=1920245 RepID=UPI003A8E9D4A